LAIEGKNVVPKDIVINEKVSIILVATEKIPSSFSVVSSFKTISSDFAAIRLKRAEKNRIFPA
jgi:hypothetical protein